MYIIKRSLVFLVIVILTVGLKAQDKRVQQINSLLTKAHEVGIFNGNALVVEKGKVIYQTSLGYSDGSQKTALNSKYRFNIGSIGKEFNAVGIMMLKERHKLSPDDKVSKYLADLPPWADRISIRNLLQYTSGLPDVNWKTIKSDADILNDFKSLKQLNFEPGTGYAYNNANVFLQRRIIEKITGLPFHQFVEREMLRPCKMNSAVVDPPMDGPEIAVSFNNDFVQSPRQFAYVMSGWTAVTAEDLYKWNRCLHDWKLIDRASFAEILVPSAPNRQSGLGGGSLDGKLIKEHFHQGSSADFEAYMYTDLPQKTTIILLTNNMNFKLFDLKDGIKAILEGKPYTMPKRSLLRTLKTSLDGETAAEILARYQDLKTNQPDEFNFNDEKELNSVGYYLMNKKRLDEAVKIFELNVKLFPQSGNAYDSLGEAYFNQGNTESALLNYKKSLELDSTNTGAKEMIKKLENK